MFKLVVLIIAPAATLAGLIGLTVWAATPKLAVGSVITVNGQGSGNIKHVFTFKNGGQQPATADLSALGGSIKGLSAKDENGAKLGTSLSENGQTITVDIPEKRQKAAGNWSFTIEYSSNVLSDFGNIELMQVPTLASNLSVTSHSLRVAADLDLGFASVRGPKPSKTGVGIGQQLIDFNDKDSAIGASIGIVFGSSTRATVTLKHTLKNNNWWWKEIALTLPPDTNQQTVRLTSLDPEPTNVRLDRDGNILAVYRLGPLGQKEVTAVVDVSLSALTYKLDDEAPIKDTDPLLIERYTRLTNSWRPMGLTLDITPDTPASSAVKTVFDAVVTKIKGEGQIDQPLALAERSIPLKYADWLVGELRSRGIPARVVLGLVLTDGERVTTARPSAWGEVYIHGTGWTTVDPWLAAHSGVFGAADPQHIALGLWGLEDDRPPVPLESASVEFSDEQLPEAGEPTRSITAIKYVWLPFVSVLSTSVNHGQPTIVDDVTLKIGEVTQVVGSVAPHGTVQKRTLVAGTKAFGREKVAVGQSSGDQFTTWQEVESTLSYWPLVVELLIVALILIGRWWWQRRTPSGRRFRPSKESLMLHDEASGGNVESENLFQPPSVHTMSPSAPVQVAPVRPPRLIQ